MPQVVRRELDLVPVAREGVRDRGDACVGHEHVEPVLVRQDVVRGCADGREVG